MGDNHIISTIYPTDTDLEILRLRRSSCQREFVCYFSTWECVYSLLILSLGFICLCSGYVYLYICKKNKKKTLEKKIDRKKKHMCVYAWYSPSLSMYIDIWGSFYQVSLLMGVRMWAFRDPLFFVFILSYFFESEMSDLLLGTLGHCPFHHYAHYWCDFTPCLTWVDHHFSSYIHCFAIILVIACDSAHSLHPRCFFPTLTYSRFDISLASFLRISLPVHFASSSHY